MRTSLYSRQSKDSKKSVAEQAAEQRADIEGQGWTVAVTYSDGSSASRFASKARSDWPKLLADIKGGHIDAISLWESSRGDRTLTSWSALLDLCRERRVLIRVTTHNRTYDLTNPRDWRVLAEDGVDNAYESEKTRERVLRGVRANAAAGRPHGKLLYGYRREYDDRGTFVRQIEHPEQAPVIREAARRVAAGEACNAIAGDFNARGIPAPRGGRWDLTQIKRLVTNPGYIGQRVHRGQIIGAPAIWPAILDEGTFAACARFLSDPRRKTVRDTTVKHLLTATARCGVEGCGDRLVVQKNRGFQAYLCRRGFCVSIKCELLNQYVEAHVFEWMSWPDILDRLGVPEDQADAAAAVARNEVVEKQARLDGFYAQAADGKLSPEGMAAIEARLLPEIQAAKWKARAVHVPPVLRALAGPDPARVWKGMTMGQRREAVYLLMDVRVLPTVRGARRFRPERVQIAPKF